MIVEVVLVWDAFPNSLRQRIALSNFAPKILDAKVRVDAIVELRLSRTV